MGAKRRRFLQNTFLSVLSFSSLGVILPPKSRIKKGSESSERFFYMISQQIIKRLMCWRVIFHINKLCNFYGRFTNKCFPFPGLLCSAFRHPANDAICAIANLTWYSKYLLQYFSIYYRNLTLRVVMLLQLRSLKAPRALRHIQSAH